MSRGLLIKTIFLLMFFLLESSSPVFAGSMCDSMKRDSPDMYKLYCTEGSQSAKPAGSNSSFTESFKLSPASLPNEPSPYGLETIGSQVRNNGSSGLPTFSIIKGFHKFGAGFSTSGNNTFYGNDVYQRLNGRQYVESVSPQEQAHGKFPNVNVGTAFTILDASFLPKVQLGVSGRYNHTTNTFGGGPAIMLSSSFLTFGAGFTREKVSMSLPTTMFYSYLVNMRIWVLELEYDVLTTDLGRGLTPIQIFSASAPYKKLVFTVATRRLNYLSQGTVNQFHWAIQFLLTSKLTLGFLYNYIPGANSVGLQIFL